MKNCIGMCEGKMPNILEQLHGTPNLEQRRAISNMIAMHKGGMVRIDITVITQKGKPVIAQYKNVNEDTVKRHVMWHPESKTTTMQRIEE
jgi:hypothetical protein